MPRNFLPGSDSGLLSWSAGFVDGVVAQPGHFGIEPTAVAALQAARVGFVEAYRAAKEPRTRGPYTVGVKNEKRQALVAAVRSAAGIVRADADLDADVLVGLGLTPRRKPRQRVPRPAQKPRLRIKALEGRRVEVKLDPEHSTTRRGRPIDVASASVLMFVGPVPPAVNVARPRRGKGVGVGREWALCRQTSGVKLTVALDPGLEPGTAVWFTAAWSNARAEHGPLAEPVRARVPFDESVNPAGRRRVA